jgi:hypothetical protein
MKRENKMHGKMKMTGEVGNKMCSTNHLVSITAMKVAIDRDDCEQ